MLLKTAPTIPENMSSFSAIAAASTAQWEPQKSAIRSALEAGVYGTMPRAFDTAVTARRIIQGHSYDGTIEELDLRTSYFARHAEDQKPQEKSLEYTAVLITPPAHLSPPTSGEKPEPIPIIMMENHCPNHSVFPDVGISKPEGTSLSCGGNKFLRALTSFFFGRYIKTPPINTILSRGYGIALIYPSQNFPDDAQGFELLRPGPDPSHPWGAIGAWAYQFSSLSNALSAQGYTTTIAYGHSRYGKSALVAAAFDPSIDGVIAHQSGTGGASLSRGKKGESVAAITRRYPHWFTPAYQEDAMSYDQHHLLALIAPRPILLGNARRDVWSDPEGAFKAGKAASSVYRLYGASGLSQNTLTDFTPSAGISFWIRPGTHGVVKEDWPAFLHYMDAHFR